MSKLPQPLECEILVFRAVSVEYNGSEILRVIESVNLHLRRARKQDIEPSVGYLFFD